MAITETASLNPERVFTDQEIGPRVKTLFEQVMAVISIHPDVSSELLAKVLAPNIPATSDQTAEFVPKPKLYVNSGNAVWRISGAISEDLSSGTISLRKKTSIASDRYIEGFTIHLDPIGSETHYGKKNIFGYVQHLNTEGKVVENTTLALTNARRLLRKFKSHSRT